MSSITRKNLLPLTFGTALLSFLSPVHAAAVATDNDGDWSLKSVLLNHTPEAERMVRIGDIDNLNFGWPAGFDPFSGNHTPAHAYPWIADDSDPSGTDRIMVITSFDRTIFGDGYSYYTSRPDNEVRPLQLTYPVNDLMVTSATLQLFVDDFQSPVFGSNYQVTLNGKRVPSFEAVINNLVQTGPIGNLITLPVPPELLDEVRSGSLSLKFDDLTTHAGDGYAIDFVKLLINPAPSTAYTGAISGRVTASSGAPLAGAVISAGTVQTISSQNGDFTLPGVPAGSTILQAGAAAYDPQSHQAAIVAGQTTGGVNFTLRPAGSELAPAAGLTGLHWSTGGNALWSGHNDGPADIPVAMTGLIGDNEATWMETTFYGPGTLTFTWKSYTESGYDALHLTVRGVETGSISGETAWTPVSVNLPAGPSIVRWTYRKDSSSSAGADAAWVSGVNFTPLDSAGAATAAGLSGDNAAPEAMPFNDGVANLLKYAFNLDLGQPAYRHLSPGAEDVSGLPAITTVRTDDGLALRVEYLRRKNTALLYTPTLSTSLTAGSWNALSDTPLVTDIDPFWERVIYTHPILPGSAAFVRVEVTGP